MAKFLKRLLSGGTGVVLPEKSVVMMHYEGYFENEKQPFDSTRLRNRPYKFLLGDEQLIPGLELAIKSMKKEEISRFIVHSDYAYGPMGCPPRIPGGAEVFYEVEIIHFIDSKAAIEYEDMTPEDQKRAPFEKIAEIYHFENQTGNDLFRRRLYKPAIARYRHMVKLLEDVSVSNEEEDQKRNGYLLKLYLNLAQSYLNLNNPNKAIIYSDLALKLDPENPKGLYRMGVALDKTEEYERAEYYLNKAKKHKPYEKSINVIMLKLEKKRRQYQDWEKQFCKNMFGKSEEEKKPVMETKENKEFLNIIESEIQKFMESNETELKFSSGYTDSQIQVVQNLANQYGLAFVSKIQDNRKVIKIAKKV
ncbi:inactive peptidyl-prolyl cis-trans isomerase FKBP6-like [Uloborus diversus]|uniref:inactive peptidyl-prolyl cis-trans isomerase FKBP6-like n=1 Tax=Uloborus diversus TaxID=327109 RepID=UPI002409A6E4|nr:inactive peptidyl-prolyl cis-trans isomerase FKBP6-like [Uloborus diversus]